MSVTINGAVSPRQPACARGTAVAALVNVTGWLIIAVALWAGIGGAVHLWIGGLAALVAVPAAGWDQRRMTTSSTTSTMINSSSMDRAYPS